MVSLDKVSSACKARCAPVRPRRENRLRRGATEESEVGLHDGTALSLAFFLLWKRGGPQFEFQQTRAIRDARTLFGTRSMWQHFNKILKHIMTEQTMNWGRVFDFQLCSHKTLRVETGSFGGYDST